jgi:hypothetical protein
MMWETLMSGMPSINAVFGIRLLDDGNSPQLYAIVGLFGGTVRAMVWSPPEWVAADQALVEGASPELSFDDGTGMAIYGWKVVDTFTAAPARWTGTEWQILGGPTNRYAPSCFAVYDDGSGPALYVGGSFDTIGGATAHRMARWTGTTWQPLGPGPAGYRDCRHLAVIQDGPAAGLYFLATEEINSPYYIQKWDGQQWTVLPAPSGPPNSIYTVTELAAFDDGSGPAIYLGGTFPWIGGFQANGLARWDGSAWSPVGAGISAGGVIRFAVFEEDPRGRSLYIRGPMEVSGGQVPSRLVQWVGCPNCYANCDNSAAKPKLNVDDFICFIDRFAVQDPYADCNHDGSLNIADFICFVNRFAVGCP